MNAKNTIYMLRQELQLYFDKVYPFAQISEQQTLVGPVHIRFELGGELENGTIERVAQATDRALTLFYDTFENSNKEIWVLIYEYEGPNIYNASNDYLHQQFPANQFVHFYKELNEDVRIIIGKLPVKDINIKNILGGIANTEMGFDPGIDQTIFFFDSLTDKAFNMYDDRGCFVWSDEPNKIRDIYTMRSNWIVEYHRKGIDEYFK